MVNLLKLKPEQYFIILVYAVVFLIVNYFVFANLFPKNVINTSGVYSLSAGEIGIDSNLRSLYVEGNALGGDFEGKRLIISEEPFNFVFNPKKVVAEDTLAELQILFSDVNTEVYLDDELIIPNLRRYSLVKDFEDSSVWVKKDLVKEEYDSGSNAEDFVYSNFPQNSIYSFVEFGGTPLVQDYRQEETRIRTQFRDNLKLAVYTEDSLEIRFTKQDLNMYLGADEYTVRIEDYQGNLYFEEVYEDGGEKKATNELGKEQNFRINLYDLPRNIYYISFVKDKINQYADSTIKNIRINSNKVLILDKCLPLDEFKFYTKVNDEKTIGFYFWGLSKVQEIKVSGTKSKIIDLNEDWFRKKYEEKLEKGEYNFEITKSYLWVFLDVISPFKKNWFYLPVKADSKLIDSDVIIIDKNKLEINDEGFLYKKQVKVNKNSKFKVQILDKLEIYFKDFKLIFGE